MKSYISRKLPADTRTTDFTFSRRIASAATTDGTPAGVIAIDASWSVTDRSIETDDYVGQAILTSVFIVLTSARAVRCRYELTTSNRVDRCDRRAGDPRRNNACAARRAGRRPG